MISVDLLSVDKHFTLVSKKHAHDNSYGGGLTGTVSTEKSESRTAVSGYGNISENFLFAEAFKNILNFKFQIYTSVS